MVVDDCAWLPMVVDGCGWLWVVVGGCGWLWMVVAGCILWYNPQKNDKKKRSKQKISL